MIVLGLSGLPRSQARRMGQPLFMDPATAVDTFSRIALDRPCIEGFVVEPTTRIDPPAPVPGSAG